MVGFLETEQTETGDASSQLPGDGFVMWEETVI